MITNVFLINFLLIEFMSHLYFVLNNYWAAESIVLHPINLARFLLSLLLFFSSPLTLFLIFFVDRSCSSFHFLLPGLLYRFNPRAALPSSSSLYL